MNNSHNQVQAPHNYPDVGSAVYVNVLQSHLTHSIDLRSTNITTNLYIYSFVLNLIFIKTFLLFPHNLNCLL